jgi:hypothetical protein
MARSVWNIVLKMPPTARGWRVTVLVYDAASEALLTMDEGNLMTLTGRQRMVGGLVEQLGLDEATASSFGSELDRAWLAFYEAYQKSMKAGPAQESAAELLEGMPANARLEAEALLHNPNLLDALRGDFTALGIAGESTLATTIFLGGVSRLLDKPLSVRVHGPSTSGKSFVIGKIADLFPRETALLATHMTSQALYYMPPGSLRHRFVVAGERSRVEGDHSADTTRALREMITAGRLSKLTPVRMGGKMVTKLIEQDGPIAFVESTSLARVFDEDANRCLALHTDERPEQTERIIKTLAARYQGETAPAVTERIVQKHHALQRLLQPYPVLIPYAARLGEQLDYRRVELRRGFPQVISTVQAVTLLFQYQRERDAEGRLVATAADYQRARRLLLEPMRRLLGGGISDPARRFFDRLREWADGPFTTAEARQHDDHSRAAVHAWLKELDEAGLVRVVVKGRGRSPATWELTNNDPEYRGTVLPPVEEVCPKAAKTQERGA